MKGRTHSVLSPQDVIFVLQCPQPRPGWNNAPSRIELVRHKVSRSVWRALTGQPNKLYSWQCSGASHPSHQAKSQQSAQHHAKAIKILAHDGQSKTIDTMNCQYLNIDSQKLIVAPINGIEERAVVKCFNLLSPFLMV